MVFCLKAEIMIQLKNCSKAFGAEDIFHNLTVSINPEDKIGLIGPNGCGKTTLMQIIAGLQKPDLGSVTVTQPGIQIAYLPQQVEAPLTQSVAEFLAIPCPQLDAAYSELEKRSLDILHQPQAYQELLDAIQTSEAMLENILPMQNALNLEDIPLSHLFMQLSSGQKTRVALMKIALQQPDLVLLDEPTNHLDETGREWLIQWVRQSQAALLMVSHDRDFIDQVAQSIWYLDKEHQEMIEFSGNYSDFKAYQQMQKEKVSRAYDEQREEIAQLKQAVKTARAQAVKKKGGKGDSGDKFAKGYFNDRTTHMLKKATHLEKRLEDLQSNLEVPEDKDWLLSIRFRDARRSGERVLEAQHIAFGYGDRVIVSCDDLYVRFGDRIVLSGKNGSGKTTILQTLAGNLPAVSGVLHSGYGVQRGYLTQEQNDLPSALNPVGYLQSLKPADETVVRNFLARYLFTHDKVLQPIASLSNGEKKRLALAGLVYSGCNLLLLDEPLNHLDIPAREQIQAALQQFSGTILVVEHDPYFIRTFPTLHWHIEQGALQISPRK